MNKTLETKFSALDELVKSQLSQLEQIPALKKDGTSFPTELTKITASMRYELELMQTILSTNSRLLKIIRDVK